MTRNEEEEALLSSRGWLLSISIALIAICAVIGMFYVISNDQHLKGVNLRLQKIENQIDELREKDKLFERRFIETENRLENVGQRADSPGLDYGPAFRYEEGRAPENLPDLPAPSPK